MSAQRRSSRAGGGEGLEANRPLGYLESFFRLVNKLCLQTLNYQLSSGNAAIGFVTFPPDPCSPLKINPWRGPSAPSSTPPSRGVPGHIPNQSSFPQQQKPSDEILKWLGQTPPLDRGSCQIEGFKFTAARFALPGSPGRCDARSTEKSFRIARCPGGHGRPCLIGGQRASRPCPRRSSAWTTTRAAR